MRPKGIATKVTGLKGDLTIFANGQRPPDQASLIGVIERGFVDLEIDSVARVKVYGKSAQNPEDSWSDEIVFFERQASATKTTGRFSKKVLQKNCLNLLAGASSRSRKLLSNKKLVYGFIGLAFAGLAVSVGLTGFKMVQARSAYATTIKDAKVLVSEATVSEADGIEQLKSKLTQLQKARQLLRGIPESQSSTYQAAKQELSLIAQNIDNIETAISEARSVADKVSGINGALAKALASVDQPPYSIEDWNNAKRELASGITKLESIPRHNPSVKDIQSQIKEYKLTVR